jgi:hypothetical protein
VPKKTLERLTFEFLQASSLAGDAEGLAAAFPIFKNKLAFYKAEDRFVTARNDLIDALGDMPITQYLQGLQDLVEKSIEHASSSWPSASSRRPSVIIK